VKPLQLPESIARTAAQTLGFGAVVVNQAGGPGRPHRGAVEHLLRVSSQH
jgi:hypothetical protein